ncbi:MAG: iron ABC transporter permease [Hyphomonadaceae bacterium]|nr:iron ABC transporter permease [Hyphomonadaceae bacterium]
MVAAIATLVCAAPAVAVLALALTQGGDADFGAALIAEGAVGTTTLVLAGGAGALVFGAAAAWLVTLCNFPGRRVFEWALAIPLAAPSYILAYAYASMTWAGRSFIPVEGMWGVAFIYAVGLYPYVYLAARAAFASQSACALEAARMLGASPMRVFWRVALPLARPGIAAGAALACMEIAADYGAAQHFGLSTLSTAIFRAWYAHGSPAVALQISGVLLVAAMVFLFVERSARGRASFAGGSSRWRPLPRYNLKSLAATAAVIFCALLIVFGALLPLLWLARLAVLHANVQDIAGPFANSLLLSTLGTLITLALASAIAVAARRASAWGKTPLFAAGMGYAAPGAVIALGALSLFGLARDAGWVGGLSAALSLTALFWTYAARFSAAGVGPVDAGLARLSKGLDASARTLGAGPWRRFFSIDLPIAAPSLAAAALILFVEILKELPATLILRPFNFDTLAVKAYSYASDERLLQAAAPSLLIFLAGLAPIVILARSIERGRAGVTP